MKISIIVTGGTISSSYDERGIRNSGSVTGVIESILRERPKGYPEVILRIANPFTMLSENMVPSDWLKLAESICAEVNSGAQAIVITHGTDTLSFSMNAISLLLDPLSIPVVFTGALLPYGHKDSLAAKNLWDAILFATKCEYAGVYLAFQTYRRDTTAVMWGPRVQKMSSFQPWFTTTDNMRVASVRRKIVTPGCIPRRWKISRDRVPSVAGEFSDLVCVIQVHPGFDPAILRLVASLGKKIVILDLYHSGTACTRNGNLSRYSLAPIIRQLCDDGLGVFGTGMSLSTEEQYRSTIHLIREGLEPLGHMSLDMALVKSMYLLGGGASISEIKERMKRDIVGELGGQCDE